MVSQTLYIKQLARKLERLILCFSSCVVWIYYIYRVSHELRSILLESVPYVRIYRYNPKHLCPKLNGYGDNGQRNLKLWQLLLIDYQIPIETGRICGFCNVNICTSHQSNLWVT
jgi:hypothetical protein